MSENKTKSEKAPPNWCGFNTCDGDLVPGLREKLAKLEADMHAIRYALLFFTPDDNPDISTLGLAEAAKATVAGDYKMIVGVCKGCADHPFGGPCEEHAF